MWLDDKRVECHNDGISIPEEGIESVRLIDWEAGMSDTRFEGILAQLTKLREGFVEVGEKP